MNIFIISHGVGLQMTKLSSDFKKNCCMNINQVCMGLQTSQRTLCIFQYIQGVCQGDSGGPLVAIQSTSSISYTLTGVVSWGEIPCAVSPQIYANVSYFRCQENHQFIIIQLIREARRVDSRSSNLLVSRKTLL